mgnify:CR=1 FL=1
MSSSECQQRDFSRPAKLRPSAAKEDHEIQPQTPKNIRCTGCRLGRRMKRSIPEDTELGVDALFHNMQENFQVQKAVGITRRIYAFYSP